MTPKKSYWRIMILLVLGLLVAGLYYVHQNLRSYFSAPNPNELLDDFNDAEIFISNGYQEIKSLSFQLLTLLTSILIFSITFSEKIVNFNQAKTSTRVILIFGWSLLIFAIIFDGIGIAYNAYALPLAFSDKYYIQHDKTNSADFYEPAFQAIVAIIFSGVLFLLSMICIVFVGAISVFKKNLNPA